MKLGKLNWMFVMLSGLLVAGLSEARPRPETPADYADKQA